MDYEHAKLMSAAQIISLYHFDHGVLHALDGQDEPWNLTPRLISGHREKSRRDTSIVAKVKRIERDTQEFRDRILRKGTADRVIRQSSYWGSRPFPKRKSNDKRKSYKRGTR